MYADATVNEHTIIVVILVLVAVLLLVTILNRLR